ncbi:uncharacterized protein TRAVEDRAFT_64370 [Trametes versicolor FP-101664 SS1]|uniref:uncharacterized protein n=1 Tax=Trametes versicolor (strain FP-101664) TaxID=717944 RepID=UPI0004621A09|nr:uncharacterized protein TRAVEDRAFT_64370 [Trametes versicolor FP-101664 SS1]EIW59196.1 hypothetical protein TRAVEDRAFT_64370 [Trametes versicolor FP-101664 SS1]
MPRRTVFVSPSTSRTTSGSPVKPHAGSAGSPPGSVSIFGIAVLENPRLADPAKPRSITYDASFWMGDGLMPLTACFRYFNKENAEVPDHGAFVLMAMVAQPTEDAELCTNARHTDYDLIGDIVWMTYAPDADARKCPVMMVNGPAREISGRDDNPASFKITANQFVQQLKDANPGHISAVVEIPDNGRFKAGKKPLPPNEGSNAAVVGQLTAVERAAPAMVAESFHLSMENVAYFPRSHSSLPVHQPSTPENSKRKWAFEDPLTTPLNPSKKRAISTDSQSSTSPSSPSSSSSNGKQESA